MIARICEAVQRHLIWLVLILGALGIAAPAPGRSLTDAGAVNWVLAVLVASVGLSLDPAQALPGRSMLRRCGLVLVVSTVALPALAWVASRLVDDPALRAGVLSAGVAPAEVASVAIVGLVGGGAATAMALLVASTLLCVVLAGPILNLLAGQSVAAPSELLGGLVMVIGLPLLAGMAAGWLLRRRAHRGGATPTSGADPVGAAAELVSLITVLALVWLVAAQIELSLDYLQVTVALTAFLAGSVVLGSWLAAGLGSADRWSVLLPVGMRDFAIAAGVATQAFGPAAAAPLGSYGLLVLLLGAAATRLAARAEHPASDPAR